ncbi:hypothetical protein ACFWEJ_16495 [Promicromonospora sp. NPDC060204]|uniref:hypothetical protein n=1 Tax=Promicromonospora sp. NPDC060204 TaxID=3347071 RepID=UPI003665D088
MSPETIARSVQRLNAAGVGWPTTRRVAITVRLAGLADVIALGEAVVQGPAATRAAVGDVLRTVGQETDPAAALREIAKVQRVLSVMGPPAPAEVGERTPRPQPEPAPARLESAPPRPEAGAGTEERAETPARDEAPGPRPLPVRPVRTTDQAPSSAEGPA